MPYKVTANKSSSAGNQNQIICICCIHCSKNSAMMLR